MSQLQRQPSLFRNRRRVTRRRNRGNAIASAITAPLSIRPQGFGPSRMSINCTKILDGSDYNTLIAFKWGDVLNSTQEFQTYSPRYEIYKILLVGVTVYPSAVPSGPGNAQLYILNRWAESSLIDAQSMKVADGVKIVPANIVRPKTFTFTIPHYESTNFNMQSWHDVNNNGWQSWIYIYSGSIAVSWSVTFNIRVCFAQSTPLTMPTAKLTSYTIINGERVVNEDKKEGEQE